MSLRLHERFARRRLPALACGLGALLCAACSKEEARNVLAGDEVVVATVNQTPITLYEVEMTARRTLGEQVASTLDAAGKRKVLESLVQSRAVAQLAEGELDVEERAALDKRVSAFREELLVQAYLDRHITPTPVTGDMVRAYYDSHKDRFGGKRVMTYEMLASDGAPVGEQREAMLGALRDVGKRSDWSALAVSLQRSGHALTFRRGDVAEAALDPQLKKALAGLTVGQSSNVIMLGGRLYVARVVEDRVLESQPIEQVADQIRRTLAPVRVKEAVKGASKQALKKAAVVYQNEERLAGG